MGANKRLYRATIRLRIDGVVADTETYTVDLLQVNGITQQQLASASVAQNAAYVQKVLATVNGGVVNQMNDQLVYSAACEDKTCSAEWTNFKEKEVATILRKRALTLSYTSKSGVKNYPVIDGFVTVTGMYYDAMTEEQFFNLSDLEARWRYEALLSWIPRCEDFTPPTGEPQSTVPPVVQPQAKKIESTRFECLEMQAQWVTIDNRTDKELLCVLENGKDPVYTGMVFPHEVKQLLLGYHARLKLHTNQGGLKINGWEVGEDAYMPYFEDGNFLVESNAMVLPDLVIVAVKYAGRMWIGTNYIGGNLELRMEYGIFPLHEKCEEVPFVYDYQKVELLVNGLPQGILNEKNVQEVMLEKEFADFMPLSPFSMLWLELMVNGGEWMKVQLWPGANWLPMPIHDLNSVIISEIN